MKQFENLSEVKVDSREIFEGKVLHVFEDTVELPNGKLASREIMRHVGAVAVIPITEDGKVVVERQFRYPINRIVKEIPAGKLDAPTEDRLSAAQRELEEETGFLAKEWISLGDFIPACAYCDERITIYMAKGLYKGHRHLDEDEFLNVELVDMDELVQEVMDGKIVDGKTIVAVMKAAYLERK